MNTVLRPTRWLTVAALITVSALLAIVTSGMAFARDETLQILVDAPTDATATVLTVDGTARTAGTRTPGTEEPVSGSEHFRIGSITKTFVATVVLQLVDEGRVALDAPIAKYLPGTVRDGDRITVRQILQHTSGIPDYMKTPGWSTNRWRGEDRFRDYRPDQLLQQAFTRPPDFAPGAKFRYSNSNYIVAGLLIEAVTGRPYGTEIDRRILGPLHLAGTSLPGSNPRLPEPALRAVAELDGRRVDVTEQNESLDWAAGEMISTQPDLATFFDALLGGRLLSEQTLAEMRRTVPMGSGFHYGLGLERFDLPCGGQVWGHGGQLLGYVTYAYRRDDGRTFGLLEVSGSDDGFLRFAAMATAVYCPR
ncbi:serine hydrolase domain-containing protein [Nocardia cyriacigeorgica]|uniref:serine hydrolase domain-containing protein n=1 Tax=Nocardia cyriacigeorgica TaxID=135487 RepID=UPI00245583A4|nr:serine hydrolase domain-containing protein [Nocardia cyriacigeorgica]